MKKITEAGINAQLEKIKFGYRAPFFDPEVRNQTARVINSLFIELESICPAFKQSFANQQILDTAKKNWLEEFIIQNLFDMEEINFGYKKFRSNGAAFPPTVSEFIKLCRPERELSIPCHEEYKALPKPFARKDIASKNIFMIKEILNT